MVHRNFQGYTTKAGTDLIGFGMSVDGRATPCAVVHTEP